MRVNKMSKKLEGVLSKSAFVWVDTNTINSQLLKRLRQMLEVILFCDTSNKYIIHISKYKIKSTDNIINKPLENTGHIPQAKRHRQELKQPKGVQTAVFSISSGFIGI